MTGHELADTLLSTLCQDSGIDVRSVPDKLKVRLRRLCNSSVANGESWTREEAETMAIGDEAAQQLLAQRKLLGLCIDDTLNDIYDGVV